MRRSRDTGDEIHFDGEAAVEKKFTSRKRELSRLKLFDDASIRATDNRNTQEVKPPQGAPEFYRGRSG